MKFTRKTFMSVALASMLATSAYAATDAADLRVVPVSDTVKVDQNLTFTVDLLKSDGSLDTVEALYGNSATVLINSDDPNAECGKLDGNITKGSELEYCNFSLPGSRTVQVSIKLHDATANDGQGADIILPVKTFTVNVEPYANQARGLEIISVADNTANIKNDVDGNISVADLNISAGDSFTIFAKALSTTDSSSKDSDSNFEQYQDSPIIVQFFGTATGDGYDNNLNTTDFITEVNGTMRNGIAYINVPADTITKAGTYKIRLLAPTDNENATKIGDTYYAESGEYTLKVYPLEPDHIKVEVVQGTPDFMGLSSDINTSQSVKLNVILADKYDNYAKTVSGGDSYVISLNPSSDKFTVSDVTIDSSSDNNATVQVSPNASVADIDAIASSHLYNLTVNASSDLGDASINIPVYTQVLYMDASGLTNDQNITVVDPDTNNEITLKAGVAFKFLDNNTTDIAQVQFKASNKDGTVAVTNKPLVAVFENTTDNTQDSVSTLIDDSNLTKFKLTKAFTFDTIKFTVDLGSDNIAPLVIKTSTPSGIKADGTVQEINQTTVETADAAKISIYQLSKDIYKNVNKTDVNGQTVTVDLNGHDKLVYDSNETNATDSTVTPHIFVAVEDSYGNKIIDESNSTKVSIIPEIATPLTLTINGTDYNTSTYTTDNVGKIDNITLAAALVDSATLKAEIVDTTPTLTEAKVSTGGVNAVLKGGYVPLSVEEIDQFGNSMDNKTDLILDIDNPTKVQVYELNSSNELQEVNVGDELNTSKNYFIKGIELGDVTITVRNVSGSVTASKTLSVVDKISEITTVEENTEENTATETNTTEVTGTLNLAEGKWNLITTPVPATMPVSELANFTSGTVWEFDSVEYNYKAATELEVGKGYWVKADKQGGELTYSAAPTVSDINAQWDLVKNNFVSGKWNLLGTSFDTNVDDIKAALGIDNVYMYNPDTNAYENSGDVRAGTGFWAK